ncbi:class I SAM-dependent methyltransferase [Bradyrhizobium sp. CCGUVB23]|uniref:class I SAM-dependent methyltransferase n=1 Tax=Bradyrhizobium sp. CCGUVB23 TaxID=2949630 RepID=UPI0020B37A60|nr:class I SAM-dependent methyltransferase [Bradyrhizobium sp. CCGUVB23]MCP3468359.1 class I SAM-dependent methyltransferase [Bradyrhizobium sp. CCGUVB23]
MERPVLEVDGKVLPLPPRDLLFMNETWESFPKNGAGLLALGTRVLQLRGRPVIDIGCGFGRIAYALAAKGYRGNYWGADVLAPQINWLQSNLSPVLPNYEFHHFDAMNDRYNASGKLETEDFRIDRRYASPDAIFVLSVFTHMYEADVITYLKEIVSVMDEKSVIYATFFLSNGESRRLESFKQSSYPMKYVLNDHCSYFNADDPLHAISFDEIWLREVLAELGLHTAAAFYGTWAGRKSVLSFQDSLFLMKA